MGTQVGGIRRNRTSDWRASYRGAPAMRTKGRCSVVKMIHRDNTQRTCHQSWNPLHTRVKYIWAGLGHSRTLCFLIVLLTAVTPLRAQEDIEAIRNELRNCQRSP